MLITYSFLFILQVGLSIVKALLYVARPGTALLGRVPNTTSYVDIEQYPSATMIPGVLILQLGSPVYFANAGYLRERQVIGGQKHGHNNFAVKMVTEHIASLIS